MKKEQIKELEKELRELAKKYGLKGFSACGSTEDKYIGFLAVDQDDKTISIIVDAAMSLGRLWQHSRGSIKQILDGFEKGLDR